MKINKSLSTILLLALLFVFAQSCKKEDSNPTQPVDNTKRDLLIGNWSIDSTFENGVKSKTTVPGEFKAVITQASVKLYLNSTLLANYSPWKINETTNEISLTLPNGIEDSYKLVSVDSKILHWQLVNYQDEISDQYFSRK